MNSRRNRLHSLKLDRVRPIIAIVVPVRKPVSCEADKRIQARASFIDFVLLHVVPIVFVANSIASAGLVDELMQVRVPSIPERFGRLREVSLTSYHVSRRSCAIPATYAVQRDFQPAKTRRFAEVCKPIARQCRDRGRAAFLADQFEHDSEKSPVDCHRLLFVGDNFLGFGAYGFYDPVRLILGDHKV